MEVDGFGPWIILSIGQRKYIYIYISQLRQPEYHPSSILNLIQIIWCFSRLYPSTVAFLGILPQFILEQNSVRAYVGDVYEGFTP
jgi:hypothetical protein